MSGGRRAALDGSLLARKGAAVPAIPDESPLVLNLDDHRLEEIDPKPANPARVRSVILSEVEEHDATPGRAANFTNRLSQASGWIGLISSPVRGAALVTVTVLVAAVLWLSNGPSDTSQNQARSVPGAAPADVITNDGRRLNLTPVPEAPALPSPTVAVALPASAALAVTAKSDGSTAVAKLDDANRAIELPSVSILPVNVPSGEIYPPAGDLDSAPEIPGTLPKSVSPIPIPKAKPDIAAVPAAGRYAVQLASIAIEKRANEEAFRLQKRLGHILGEHEIAVEKAVINGKGTTYRLRAGGYRTQAEASSACAQLAKLKVSCLALRR